MERETVVAAAAVAAAGAAVYYVMMAKRGFDVARMQKGLTTKALGREVQFHDTVSSTMTLAHALLTEKGGPAVHGTVIAAEAQTAGIGRRGRSWAAEHKGNIYMSLLWHTTDRTLHERCVTMSQLNFCCGIAVARAARDLGVEAKCKWPNDVWVGSKKLSGSLVDFDGKASGVAGIGVNVNQTSESLESAVGSTAATSLSAESGRELSREEVMCSICNTIESLMAGDLASTMAEYAKFDMLTGRLVRVCHNSREVAHDDDYDAVVLGFFPNGNLKVARVGNPDSEIALSGEEISIRPQ